MKDFISTLKKEVVLRIDYNSKDLPQSVRELKPTVYLEDKNTFCCILGEDPEAGIFGCGRTPFEALLNWDQHLQQKAAGERAILRKVTGKHPLWVSWLNEHPS
jgi:hypothetical protein